MLKFKLRPILQPGDLVAVFDSSDSRNEALAYLRTGPKRVRQNADAIRIATHPVDAHRSITTLRYGGSL